MEKETKNMELQEHLIKLNHKITYKDNTLFDRYIILNKDEQKEFRNIIYKYDLICIFGLYDFLEDIINKKIIQLYDIMIKNHDIDNITIKLSEKYSTTKENGFILLFAFDNLHLFYPCICEFIEKGVITNEKIESLVNNIL
jgi:hypothetical protein